MSIKTLSLEPALKLIREFEGCKLHAYKDAVGVPTIGWGTTKGVNLGMVITQEEADRLLVQDILNERLPAIKRACKVELSNNERCALVSFCYNVGVGALIKSTLMQKLNAGKPKEQVANEFNKWVKAGGQTLKGLVRRRAAEKRLFLTPDPPELPLT